MTRLRSASAPPLLRLRSASSPPPVFAQGQVLSTADDATTPPGTRRAPPNREHVNFFHYLRKRWKGYAVALLAVLVLVLLVAYLFLRFTKSDEEDVSSQLEMLKQQHKNLIAQTRKAAGPDGSLRINDLRLGAFLDCRRGPPEEYENLRRRVYSNTKELWYYVKNKLGQMMKNGAGLEKIKDIVEEVGNRKRSLLSDQEKMAEFDGYHEWRIREAAIVSDLVQRRLKHLQNPPDCRQARKLVCSVDKYCGFGCEIHHSVYCLIFAYATERTLILNSRGWRYNTRGWEYSFMPLSDSCTSTYDEEIVQRPEINISTLDAKIVSLPFEDAITLASRRPMFQPLAIPEDLAPRILKFNGDPASWWIGQVLKYILKPQPSLQKQISETRARMNFKSPIVGILKFNGDPASWWIGQVLKYILKPQPSLQKQISETRARMNFKSPIVGVHIRRTDKGTQQEFHHLDEYMTHVKDYYDKLELTRTVDERRVYLASDDVSVQENARSSYPNYKFLSDATIAKGAAPDHRYTPSSLAGLLVDLHMLASCDYLVGTFSSGYGKVAYEMMQTSRPDASESYSSLDDIYYVHGQNAHNRAAVLRHDAAGRDEISFRVGDLIRVAGNHWNGYGRGTNRRTNKTGLFPWYKTADHLVLYPFPRYKEVPLYDDTRQNDL